MSFVAQQMLLNQVAIHIPMQQRHQERMNALNKKRAELDESVARRSLFSTERAVGSCGEFIELPGGDKWSKAYSDIIKNSESKTKVTAGAHEYPVGRCGEEIMSPRSFRG